MRVTEFEKQAQEKMAAKGIKRLTAESLKWFEREVKKHFADASTVTRSRVKQFGVERQQFLPGQLVLYGYDAKYKDTLPIWDAMPLILVTKIVEGGWYGINFHYIKPQHRLMILSALYAVNNRRGMIEKDKMRLSWQIAEKAAASVGASKHLNQCIKRYLSSHVKTPPLVIDPNQWDMMVFLPLARFQKGKPY